MMRQNQPGLACHTTQQILDLSRDLTQPLKHWSEFYDSNADIQSRLTRNGFARFIKQNRSFFCGAIVSLRSGIYLREAFLDRFNEWLSVNKQEI